jgi:hypothetical protein
MELKFRAWDEIKQEFIYSDQIAGGMWRYFKTLEDRGIRHFMSEQYIGIDDINGTAIYKGDKVRLASQIAVQTKLPQLYDKIVEWNPKTCGWNIRPMRKNHKGYLIVGNIHEDTSKGGNDV